MELSTALPTERLTVDGAQKPAIKIGIVGCGSRGLTVLERVCALAGAGSAASRSACSIPIDRGQACIRWSSRST